MTAREIDIRPSAEQMLRRPRAPVRRAARSSYDITFENVQAGERTSHLFRLANHHGGLVIGTGDLSELALGWATYGVGDQMSHYAVNASVPKTLISFMLRWVIDTGQFDADVNAVLQSVLDTEISPELIPADGDKPTARQREQGRPVRAAGLLPLLHPALRLPAEQGRVPGRARVGRRRARPVAGPDPAPTAATSTRAPTIKHWLGVFLFRFFQISQFKRTAIPNAPKVGSGGSLSPRGDWRAPSDARGDGLARRAAPERARLRAARPRSVSSGPWAGLRMKPSTSGRRRASCSSVGVCRCASARGPRSGRAAARASPSRRARASARRARRGRAGPRRTHAGRAGRSRR